MARMRPRRRRNPPAHRVNGLSKRITQSRLNEGKGVNTVFTAGAVRAQNTGNSRLTEALESTLKSPASSSEFDLLANTNDVLSDVGMTAADCGGRLSFYGQDPIIPSPNRFGAMAAVGLAAAWPRSLSPPQRYGGREPGKDRTSTWTFAKRSGVSAVCLTGNGKR
jgi:hypothetical protein